MKLFTKKNLIQKMTIVLVILMLFNFIMPNFVRAETAIETAGKVILTPIRGFFVMCGDAVMNGLQYLLKVNEKAVIPYSDQVEESKQFLGQENIGENPVEQVIENSVVGDILLDMDGFTTGQDKPNFKYTPKFIFENKVKSFDINFISPPKATSTEKTNEEKNKGTSSLSGEKWYENYVFVVGKCQERYNNATDDTEKGIARTVLRRLGAWSDTTNGVSYTDETAKNAISELSQRYYNGATMYEMLGADPTSKDATMKKYVEFLDNEIGTYVIGTVAQYHKVAGNLDKDAPDYDAMAPVNALHDMIATWYRILRNIALIFLLSILVYIGIRIVLSSTAADNAKYKKMLVDWVVALCILFALHYIMAGVNGATNMIVDAFTPSDSTETDTIFGNVRTQLMSENLSDQIFYTVLYLVLVIYTGVFTFYYLKRVVYAAFLTLIAPLVALTYPLDRMGDGKSQAFNMWLKEYIANVIIQPVHLLIYTVLIGSVLSLAVNNPLYAIVVMGAMMPAEKFIREMFGLNSPKGLNPAGSFAGGALAASAMNKLLSRPPRMHPRGEHDRSKDNGSENENGTKRNRIKMKDDGISDLADAVAGQNAPDVTTIGDKSKTTEDKPDIDNGDFKDSRETNNDDWGEVSANAEQMASLDSATTNNNDKSYDWGEVSADAEQMASLDSATTNNNGKSYDWGEVSASAEQMASLGSAKTNNNDKSYDWDEVSADNKQMKKLGDATKKANKSTMEGIKSPSKKELNSKLRKPPINDSTAQQKQAKKTLKKQKLAAQNAAAKKYYTQLTKKRLKSLGRFGKGLARGALKTAGAATGIALGATAGIVGGIATGDAGNALKFTGAGALAGAKFGSVIGDDVYNIGARGASGVASVVSSQKEMRQAWQDDLYNTNEDYRKQVDEKEAKKFVKSAEVKAMIQQRFGKDKIKEAQDAMIEYRKEKIENIDTMLNCFGLEQGIDKYGKKFAEPGDVSRDQAILAGRMAEQYDVNNESARKATKDNLELQLANGYYNNYSMSENDAVKSGKAEANNVMKLVDMAQGIKSEKAGLADVRQTLKKKREDAKAKEDYMDTRAWKDEYEKSKKNN